MASNPNYGRGSSGLGSSGSWGAGRFLNGEYPLLGGGQGYTPPLTTPPAPPTGKIPMGSVYQMILAAAQAKAQQQATQAQIAEAAGLVEAGPGYGWYYDANNNAA